MTIPETGPVPVVSVAIRELDAPALRQRITATMTIQIASANSPLHLQAMERPKASPARVNRWMHRIEHRRRHDRRKHLPCGRHIMHFIEIEFFRCRHADQERKVRGEEDDDSGNSVP